MKLKIIVSVFCSLLVVGCGNGYKSSPTEETDKNPAVYIRMPYHISDVGFKCNGTVGVYAAQGGGVAVLKDDPNCPGT